MKLTKKQRDFVDNLREKFKTELKTQKINPDNFELMYEDDEDDVEVANKKKIQGRTNNITIGGIVDVRSDNESLRVVESTVIRFLNKFKSKIPNYVG